MNKRELIRLLRSLARTFVALNAVSAVLMGCALDSEPWPLVLCIMGFNIAVVVAYFYIRDTVYVERIRREVIQAERLRRRRARAYHRTSPRTQD